MTAERKDGQTLTFTLTSGAWVTDSDVDATLVQTGNTWLLTDSDDIVETYTATSASAALLSTIRARNGYAQSLSYNASNQLVAVTDSFNRSIAMTYTNGLLQTVSTPDGLIITYGYNASGANGGTVDRLASVNYSTSPTTSQSYSYYASSSPFALTGVTDEDGNLYASWSYDGQNRGTSSQHAGGAGAIAVAYNDTDGSRTVTNALGEQDIYRFTQLQGVPKLTEIDRQASYATAAATRTFTYDANGYIASQSDWNGNLTTYVNNARGLPTTMVEAAGTPQARTTTTAWRAFFHQPVTIATPGLKISFTYDNRGEPVTRTETDTASGISRTWTYNWSHFELASVTGPRTDVTQQTSYAHDGMGRLTAVTNALGQTTSFPNRLPGGLPTVMIDPNGVTTKFAYDARLRLLRSQVVTAAGARTTSYSYDPAGNLTQVTLPDGSFLATGYDAAHRPIANSDALGNEIAYGLDGLGDHVQTSISVGTTGVVWQDSAEFDVLGRLVEDTRGAGQTTGFGYDNNGNLLAKVDPLSRTTGYAVDALNRIVLTTDPAGGVTRIAYDAHDRPIKVVAPNGAVTTYIRDGFGRVMQRNSPDSGTTFYYYDLADNLTQSTDGAGVVTKYAYDALNRRISASFPGNPAENVSFAYDQSGHGFGIGRLTSVADAVGTFTLSYDERGNELNETRTSGAVSLTTRYSYDLANRIAAITYPSGTQVSYVHDHAGRVIAVNASVGGVTQSVVARVGYQPFGPVSHLTYGNGVGEWRSFDADYRLTSLITGKVQALTYGYDAADNVVAINDGVTPANSQTFSHDLLDRLTLAHGVYGHMSWRYDLSGNRLYATAGGESSSTYQYLARSNRLTSIETGGAAMTFAYNGAGNIAAIAPAASAATTLTYNQSERLAAVAIGGNAVAGYAYDAFGRRFAKTLPTSSSLFQYDQSGRLLEETDGQGNARTDTIYLNGVPVASIAPATGALAFLHTDHLGTPQIATNVAKTPVWGARYEPFGGLDGVPAGSLTQNLRFPGQYADAETGWYQNGYRDYAPLWGRYLESDPIGLAGGMNTYGYVGENPILNKDPLGAQAFSETDIAEQLPSLRIVMRNINNRAVFASDFADLLSTTEENIKTEADMQEFLNKLSALTNNSGYLVDTSGLPTGPIVNWRQYADNLISNLPRSGPQCSASNPNGEPEWKPLPPYTVKFFYNPEIGGLDFDIVKNSK